LALQPFSIGFAAFHQWHRVPSRRSFARRPITDCLRRLPDALALRDLSVALGRPPAGYQPGRLLHFAVAADACASALLSLNTACKHADPFLAVACLSSSRFSQSPRCHPGACDQVPPRLHGSAGLPSLP
jgi:hypothetical protein